MNPDKPREPNRDSVATIVTEDANWAYCSEFCQHDESMAKNLQVKNIVLLKLSIYTHGLSFFLFMIILGN